MAIIFAAIVLAIIIFVGTGFTRQGASFKWKINKKQYLSILAVIVIAGGG